MDCVESSKLIWTGRQQRCPSHWLRYVYESGVGPIPDGYHVHHVCGNPRCVNTDHLEALSPQAHREAHRYHGLALGFDETAATFG